MNKVLANQITDLAERLKSFETFADYQQILSDIYNNYDKDTFNLDELTDIAVKLSSRNNSGPFGALLAIEENSSYKILSIGSNLVVTNNNSMLHAETVALINYFKFTPEKNILPPDTLLVTSCEPCSQCRSYFLAMGGKQENIRYVLNKSDAEQYGGFLDESQYKIVTVPFGQRHNIFYENKDYEVARHQIKFIKSDNSSYEFSLDPDSFVGSFISSYYNYTRQAGILFESNDTKLVINQIPEALLTPSNKSLLRLFCCVVDWSKLDIYIVDRSLKERFDPIILYSNDEISTGQVDVTRRQAASKIMQTWKENFGDSRAYGQTDKR